MKMKREYFGLPKLRDPFLTGLQAANAHRMCRHLTAGLPLSPGELQQLDTMPPGVREAILACDRPDSRYLPKFIKNQRRSRPMALGPKATQKLRQYDYWKGIHPVLASAIRHGDVTAAAEARRFRIHLPANVSGFKRVISAFADYCRVSPVMIRLYMKQAQKIDRNSTAALDRQWQAEARALARRRQLEPGLVLTPEQAERLNWLDLSLDDDFLPPDKDKKRRS